MTDHTAHDTLTLLEALDDAVLAIASAHELDAVFQHIENDQVVLRRVAVVERFLPVVCDIHCVAFFHEAALEKCRDPMLVFHD